MTALRKNLPLTAERLRELFSYDPFTGIFIRKVSIGRCKGGSVAGSINDGGYLVICIDGVNYLGHHLAWLYVYSEYPSREIDHRDNIRHHNWINNLRLATRSQNIANCSKSVTNKSGFKGVYRVPRIKEKWRAAIRRDHEYFHLGLFDSPDLAHAAYVAASQLLFGEFARTK
jgi:hypothetical protein